MRRNVLVVTLGRMSTAFTVYDGGHPPIAPGTRRRPIISNAPHRLDAASPFNIAIAAAITGVLFGFGCTQWGGPVERDDNNLTERQTQQRQRLIEPLGEVPPDDEWPEEIRGPQTPTLLEFYVDDDGQIRVDILPYLLVDPGSEPIDEAPDPDEFPVDQ